jgi:protein-tyrosine phosphatase
MVKILMVCLGNICRSPLAEGIMRKKLEISHIDGMVDSCGFESFHRGDPPDSRSVETALKNGVDIRQQRARLFRAEDFDKFDLIYVMDHNNYRDVADAARTPDDLAKVDLIMNAAFPGANLPVPDPYYGGKQGFDKTWELLDKATDAIVEKIKGERKDKR